MIYIAPPNHRTGNPTPGDSPLQFNWDSVRPDQPNYLRIDKEVRLVLFSLCGYLFVLSTIFNDAGPCVHGAGLGLPDQVFHKPYD